MNMIDARRAARAHVVRLIETSRGEGWPFWPNEDLESPYSIEDEKRIDLALDEITERLAR